MWGTLSVVSVLIGFAAFFGAIVGLIRGIIGKGWQLLAYSTVILITAFALVTFAETKTVWDALSPVGALIALMALIGAIVGLIKGIIGKGWGLLAYSTVIFIVSFVLVIVADENDGLPSYTENASVRVDSGTSARKSNVTNDVENCKDKFRARKNAVMDLHSDGLLDVFGLSDIGVLSNYGISIDAATTIADILYANGLYGLQNHYEEVAHAICAEVRHDESLIRDGTREAFVNR